MSNLSLVSQVYEVPLADLHEDPDNARVHGDKSIDVLMASLRQFHQVEPLVIQKGTNRIIGGHGRLEAMHRLGWTHARVIAADLDDLHAKALGLAMNRTPEVGTAWDRSRVQAALKKLHGDGFAIEGIGFTTDDIEGFGFAEQFHAPQDGHGGGGDTTPEVSGGQSQVLDTSALDEVEVEKAPKRVKRGEIWQLGEHRLMCGDSTSKGDVDVLMGGELASLVFTSPPYDQQREYGQKIDDWQSLMRGVFGALPVTGDAQILVNLGLVHRDGEWVPYWDPWVEWMRAQGWRRFGWYVWDKLSGMPGSGCGRPASCHEWIFHFNRKPRMPAKITPCKNAGQSSYRETPRCLASSGGAGRSSGFADPAAVTGVSKIPDSVFRTPAARTTGKPEAGHPAVYPVALAAQIVAAYSAEAENCFEPFSGSGTTIVAAEQLQRRCFGMELEPTYCDIALARWETLTGQKAERVTSFSLDGPPAETPA